MKEDKTRQEFKSAEELHRFESAMMLGQNAVYLVVTGALLNAIDGKDVSQFNNICIALFGIVLSLAFMLITHRCGLNLRGARKRAEELSEELGFKLYSSEYRAPKSKLLVGKNVIKVICAIGGVFWLVALLRLLCG